MIIETPLRPLNLGTIGCFQAVSDCVRTVLYRFPPFFSVIRQHHCRDVIFIVVAAAVIVFVVVTVIVANSDSNVIVIVVVACCISF